MGEMLFVHTTNIYVNTAIVQFIHINFTKASYLFIYLLFELDVIIIC